MHKNYLLIAAVFIFSAFFLWSGLAFAQTIQVTAPIIQVTAPNGGECFTPGSTVNITWNGAGFDHVAITYSLESNGMPPAYSVDSSAWKIAHPISGAFSYSWVTPTRIPTGVAFKIWIEGHSDSHQRLVIDSSDLSFSFAERCTVNITGAGAVPAAPTNLSASISASAVSLSWNDNATDELDYKVFRRLSGSTAWELLATLGVNAVSYTDSGLAGGVYEYHVNACNSYGCSADSNIATATVASTTASSGATIASADTTAPSIPSGLTAAPKSSSQIDLSWSSATDNVGVTGYKIYRNGVVIATISGLSYADIGLKPATSYNYNVVAFDAAGNVSALSVTVSATTFAAAGALPAAPSGLMAVVSANNVALQWIDNSTDELGFKVFKKLSGQDWQLIANLPDSTISFTDTGFLAGTYEYHVEACNINGCSASNNVSVTIGVSAIATSSLELAVSDSAGTAVSGAEARLMLDNTTQMFWGRSDADGKIKLTVPSGTYHLEVFPPPDHPDFIRPPVQKFVFSAEEVKTLTIQFLKAQKIISGKILFSDNSPVVDAEVGAYNPQTGNWVSQNVDGDGSYELEVSGGTWLVNFGPIDPNRSSWSWHEPPREVVFASDATAEVKTANFMVPLATARLIVKTLKPDGTILADAGVAVSTVSVSGQTSGVYTGPLFFQKTNPLGIANFSVAPRTFYIRAFVAPELELINPDEAVVTLTAGEEKTVILQFKRREVLVKGITKLSDGKPAAGAFIWAWSEKGGAAQGYANGSGEFSIPVSKNSRWHIGASKVINDIPYKSSELTIDIKETGVAEVELVLLEAGPALPLSTRVVRPAAETAVAELIAGAKVVVPPNAAAASGNVTIEVKPVVEAPVQPLAKVVGTVYDVTIKDQGGNVVSELMQETEIVLPYTDEDLKALKITEDELIPSFYDEKTGTWVKLTEFVIDKVNKKVIAKVKHLTRFALVAAADTTPPAAPTGVTVTQSGANLVISWVNPNTDFDHAKVYRSTELGKLGTVIFAEVRTTTRVDTNAVAGVRYYYTVRAVDPAGNESTNINQVSGFVSQLPPGQAVKAAILRDLRQGLSGDDIKTLQQKLVEEGVYPEGLITGYFGSLTKQAVIRFQEKYASEILAPLGLTNGTGVVGPLTRKKLNELSGQ